MSALGVTGVLVTELLSTIGGIQAGVKVHAVGFRGGEVRPGALTCSEVGTEI